MYSYPRRLYIMLILSICKVATSYWIAWSCIYAAIWGMHISLSYSQPWLNCFRLKIIHSIPYFMPKKFRKIIPFRSIPWNIPHLKSKRTRIFKNLKFKKLSRDWSLLQKVRKQGIIFWHRYFKNLIPTFSKHSLIMLTHCNRPKVGIKLLKVSYVRTVFLVYLLFVAVINSYSVF